MTVAWDWEPTNDHIIERLERMVDRAGVPQREDSAQELEAKRWRPDPLDVDPPALTAEDYRNLWRGIRSCLLLLAVPWLIVMWLVYWRK